MPFIPNTQAQQEEMLRRMGMTFDQLFEDIPQSLRCKPLDLPPGISEQKVRDKLAGIADKNRIDLVGFLGGGFYDHFIPAAVYSLVSRSEFYTAYTPYQPEVSQGTLQAIYEYQSAICRLTGMEVANASLYDGGTALYEAMMMALAVTGRSRILIDDSVNPIYRVMIESYTKNLNIEKVQVKSKSGLTDRAAVASALDQNCAAVILQNPNFFGCVDDYTDLCRTVREKGAMVIVSCYPVSLGILKTPGAMGADIVTGEGQSLGMPLSFGGPYLGFMATRRGYVRRMPGRVIGKTTDEKGRTGYVMTLQAREQHIRREKATSNICSNEALCAMTALVYLTLLGKNGLIETAQLCADKASYAYHKLTDIRGVRPRFRAKWFFNEFVLELPSDAGHVIAELIGHGFAAGFPLSRYYEDMENCILVAVTEKRTKQQIDRLAAALEAIL